MDNISHSLAGLAVAEAVVALRERRGDPVRPGARTALAFASILANNLPDGDLLYVGIDPRPFGYLLHHRGHTHTLVLAVPLGLVALLLALGLGRLRRWSLGRRDIAWIALVSALGGLVHIALDASNNYGVHPFWPLDDHWFYGDSVYIVEPFFWIAVIPPLFFRMRTRIGRAVLALPLAAILALAAAGAIVPRGPFVTLVLATALAFALAYALRQARGSLVVIAFGASAAILALFVVTGREARAAARVAAASAFPDERPIDVMVTPIPANPLCWDALVLDRRGEEYIVRSAKVAPAPSLDEAAACHYGGQANPTVPSAPVAARDTPSVSWLREHRAKRAELVALARRDCRVSAFLRFARVPFWSPPGEAPEVIVDLRYDRAPAMEFADVWLEGPARCPRYVPPWIPPRADLLEGP